MRTTVRFVLGLSVVFFAASNLAVDRFQGFVRAQPPREAPLEYRVDHTVRERGVVESRRSIDVRCEVTGGSTIVSIVPEGSRVEKGDLLVELDDTAWRDKLAEAEILVKRAKARVLQAEAELASETADAAATLQFAQAALQAALVEREKVLADGGELDYESTVTNSELAVATARLRATERLIERASEGSGSESLDELRLAQIEATEAIKVAEARKLLLEQYDRKNRTAQLDLAVAEKRMLCARQEHAFEKARRIAEAELTAGQLALSEDERRVQQVQQQLELCKIHAPQAGIVLYARDGASRSSRGTVIEAGAQVRERQALIQLPDLTQLRLRVHVNESRIARVRVGQPATILCDAFPNRQFQGKVVDVSGVPEPTSWLNADVKEYAVLVSIEEPVDGLRIGLTALVEIHAGDQLER